MKKTSFIVFALFIFCTNIITSIFAQTDGHHYETVVDGDTKILNGVISRSDIESDTSFKWFQQNYNLGQADANAVKAFKENASKFKMIVFFGTWCEDSQNLLPVFYRLVDKSSYPEEDITLIGVKRDKTTLDDLQKKFDVKDVPTFIVMKDGKEVGRVVEYGESGQIDKELGEIVSKP